MPVINAHCPVDQATLAALYKDKADWFEAYQLAALPKRAARLAAIESIGVEKGYAHRTKIAERVTQIFTAKKAESSAQLAASNARLEALESLESSEGVMRSIKEIDKDDVK